MGLGMIILGIGFWFMLGAVAERVANGNPEDTANKAALLWLIMTYLFHTVGELCLSPVGLSVVTKLSPPKLASILMAVWMLSSSICKHHWWKNRRSYRNNGGRRNIYLYIRICDCLRSATHRSQ